MSHQHVSDHDGSDHRPPCVAEIAALTARLRVLSRAGPDVDPAAVQQFQTDKRALLDRITAADGAAAEGAATDRAPAVAASASPAAAGAGVGVGRTGATGNRGEAHDARAVALARHAAAQWPPERHAAVRLAHARAALTRVGPDHPRRAALDAHLGVVQDAARRLIARPTRPAPTTDTAGGVGTAAGAGVGAGGQSGARDRSRERAWAGLAGMLDPNPAARAQATHDLTVAWPAEHLRLLQQQAEHARGAPPVEDPVARAATAVAALPPAHTATSGATARAHPAADTDADGDFCHYHYRPTATDVGAHGSGDADERAVFAAGGMSR